MHCVYAHEIAQLEAEILALEIEEARRCPKAFAEFVGQDEETNEGIELTPNHRRTVDAFNDPKRTRVVVVGHPESGKSELAIYTLLWRICDDLQRGIWPRAVFCNETHDQALKRAQKLADLIAGETEAARRVRLVFPELGVGRQWSQKGWRVSWDGKESGAKDPTIAAAGLDTGIHGSRIRYLVADDITTRKNQSTPESRKEVRTLFAEKILDRLGKGAVVWLLCNAWYDDSPDAVLAERPEWHEIKLTVLDENGKPTFPYKWPLWRIEEERANEIVPGDAARRLDCVRYKSGQTNRFSRDIIEGCYRTDIEMLPHISREMMGEQDRVITGVDIGGLKKRRKTDFSVLFTIWVRRTEWHDRTVTRFRVVDVRRGRWNTNELRAELRDVRDRYHGGDRGSQLHGEFVVEDNAAQTYIAQDVASGMDCEVTSLTTTGKNKYHAEYGVDAMSGQFAHYIWEIPAQAGKVLAPLVQAWVDQLLAFSPKEHTGDIAMASWIAREGARSVFQHRDDDDDFRGPDSRARAIAEARRPIEITVEELIDALDAPTAIIEPMDPINTFHHRLDDDEDESGRFDDDEDEDEDEEPGELGGFWDDIRSQFG